MDESMTAVWLVFGLLISFLLGTAAAALGRWSGQHLAKAALTGGAAFASAMTLWILVLTLIKSG